MLRRAHDCITRAGYIVAGGLVCAITLAFWFEVISRYAFDAPTEWVNASVSYILCAIIFLAAPEQTRLKAHIVITVLIERLGKQPQARLARIVSAVCTVACCVVAALCARETWSQYKNGIETISMFPVPKWWISILLPYGFFSSGLYFLRETIDPTPVDETAAQPAPVHTA
jgi:TRAP-type C4-dicarboxylate transport system permease small subunit